MAEYVMKDLVNNDGLESQFYIASSATSPEKLGNPIYPLAQQELDEHGIHCDGHIARQLQNSDYEKYDLLIGMDNTDDFEIIWRDVLDGCWGLFELLGNDEV